jgi:hypothetical protein
MAGDGVSRGVTDFRACLIDEGIRVRAKELVYAFYTLLHGFPPCKGFYFWRIPE